MFLIGAVVRPATIRNDITIRIVEESFRLSIELSHVFICDETLANCRVARENTGELTNFSLLGSLQAGYIVSNLLTGYDIYRHDHHDHLKKSKRNSAIQVKSSRFQKAIEFCLIAQLHQLPTDRRRS
jgi:hypothetical protein